MELLAEYKEGCDGLFLKLDKDAQNDIPYDEIDRGYKAYWGSDSSSDGDDAGDSDPDAYFYLQMTYTITGQQGEETTTSHIYQSESGLKTPFGSYVSDHALYATHGNSDGLGMYITGPHNPYYIASDGGQAPLPGNLSISPGGISAIPVNGGPPIPLGPDGKPPNNKSVIVKRIREDKTEETIATIPRPTKPTEAAFVCEDCEINCVLLIRKKTDKFAFGICICNKEEDWILTKAQVKAELLKELPPIIQARLKAQEIPAVKAEVKTEVREAFSTDISGAKETITNEIKADVGFKEFLAEKAKNDLMDDIEFTSYIEATMYQALRLPAYVENLMSEIKAELLSDSAFLENLTSKSKTDLLSDSAFLASLKTKLGITDPPPTGTGTTGTSGGNPMTPSGTTPTTGMPGTSGGNPFTQPFPTATP